MIHSFLFSLMIYRFWHMLVLLPVAVLLLMPALVHLMISESPRWECGWREWCDCHLFLVRQTGQDPSLATGQVGGIVRKVNHCFAEFILGNIKCNEFFVISQCWDGTGSLKKAKYKNVMLNSMKFGQTQNQTQNCTPQSSLPMWVNVTDMCDNLLYSHSN